MMISFEMFSSLFWMIAVSLFGGTLSVAIAALFALNAQRQSVPLLVSYAIGALLGAVFLEILPHAIEIAPNAKNMTATLLFGILLFFTLEKLVLWRHCHGSHCEAHAPHDEAHCPDQKKTTGQKYKPVQASRPTLKAQSNSHLHHHVHDEGRSGMMIMIGDTFHNFVDGILIAAAFMTDVKLGLVTSMAIIAHEIPQEVGDFLILLHSGYSKRQALIFNLLSSFATVCGALIAYYTLQTVQMWIPYILALAAASMLYVAVADLIPGLHKRTSMHDTLQQISLIALGVMSIALTQYCLGD